MKILVLNCGSSSLKYQLIDMEDESVLAKGLCERIGIEGSKLTHKVPGKDDFELETAMPDHAEAVQLVFDALPDTEPGWMKSVRLVTVFSMAARSLPSPASWMSM